MEIFIVNFVDVLQNRERERETFTMTRVTYGVAISSFHSFRSLSECEHLETTPKVVKEALQRDYYVEDILTVDSSASKAKELQLGLFSTLARKCLSNTLSIWRLVIDSAFRDFDLEVVKRNVSDEGFKQFYMSLLYVLRLEVRSLHLPPCTQVGDLKNSELQLVHFSNQIEFASEWNTDQKKTKLNLI